MQKIRVCLIVVLACVSQLVFADTIWLKNGDRLTGTVKKIADGKLTLSTDFAGDIEIAMDKVQGIDTEQPIALQREDGAIQEGALAVEEGAQKLVEAETPADAPLETVQRAAPNREALDKAIRKANQIWSGSVDTAATFRTGETDRYDAVLSILLKRTRESNVLTLKANGQYGETDDVLNSQRLYGEAKWDYNFSGRPLYVYGILSAEHDKLRRLESRYSTGAGVGYKFIDRPRQSLSGEVGLAYNWERWENFGIGEERNLFIAARRRAFNDFQGLLSDLNNGNRPIDGLAAIDGLRIIRRFADPNIGDPIRQENYLNARIAASLWQKVWKASVLTNELVILPDLDDVGEFRLTNTLAFMTPVAENLDFRASLRTEYDSDPGAQDVDELDNILTLGLRYSF